MMKNIVYFIVIALLIAELSKILIYAKHCCVRWRYLMFISSITVLSVSSQRKLIKSIVFNVTCLTGMREIQLIISLLW